jgi:hypothetical protein
MMAATIPNKDIIVEHLMDREWRLDNLYYVKDKAGTKTLFVRNESQRMFYNEMWYLNIILKDRQRGFSTLIAIFILDYCLFNSETSAGIIDITLTDAKLKLAKIQYAYDNLPDWLRAMYPTVTENKEVIEWENGSRIQVGTSHRGGTLQLLHISEKGKIAARFPDRAREIRTGALNTVAPGQFVFEESTAEGNAGEFYEDCQRAKELKDSGQPLTELDFKFHFFGWWMGTENELDPEGVYISQEDEKYFRKLEKEIGIKLSDRKRAWYAKKHAQQKDDMTREYPGTPEEAFESAIEGAYFGKIIPKMYRNGQITVFPFEPGIPVNTGWDFGLDDHMCIWMHQRVALQDRLVGYISGTDEDVLYYWKELQGYDCIYGFHFLPHDADYRRIGTANDPSSPPKTLEDILNDAGMRNTQVVPRIQEKWTAIQEVKNWLPKAYIDPKECEDGISCLKNFRRAWDDKNGTWKNRPQHDWAMHGYDALESLVRGLDAHGTLSDGQGYEERPPEPY